MNHKFCVFLLSLFLSIQAIAQNQPIATASDGAKDPKALKGEVLFMQGMKLYWAERYEEAIKTFKAVNEKYDPNSGSFLMMGKSYIALKNPNNALLSIKEAYNLNKENLEISIVYADLLTEAKDYKTAEKTYESILKKNPRLLDAYTGLTNLYLEQGEYESAIKTYDQLEKNIGITEEITRQKQSLYLKIDKVDKAIAEGDKLMNSEPEDAAYVTQQAQLMLGNGKVREAQEMLEAYLEKNPNYAEGHIIIAQIYQQQGKVSKCNTALQRAFENRNLDIRTKISVFGSYLALTKDKSNTNLDELIGLSKELIAADSEEAKPYVFLGDLYAKQGKPKEARDSYFQSTTYDKSIFDVWLAIIELDNQLEDWSSLSSHAEEAAEYFPNQAFFWYHMAVGKLKLESYEDAIYALEEAEMLTFDNPELLKNIATLKGDAYKGDKDYKASEAAYQDALNIDENYAPALNNYSYLLAERKMKLPQAEKMTDKLTTLFPEDASYADTHAKVLFQVGNYDKAQQVLKDWASKDSAEAGLLELYGDILFQKGEVAEALVFWKKAQSKGVTGSINQKILQEKYIE